ncbi:MAG: hypothetical protein LUH63_21410 [Parabacteroides sp.]|nr:hypothetical protein [Parabacteroides sp.]
MLNELNISNKPVNVSSLKDTKERLLFLEKIERGRLESALMLTNTKEEARNKLSKWLK